VFVEIVTESETYHIYKAVLLTIKVVTHNVSGHTNMKVRTQAPKSNTQQNTAKLDVGLLLLKRAWTSLNLAVFIFEIDPTSLHFSRS
jgi:hypothetical protein